MVDLSKFKATGTETCFHGRHIQLAFVVVGSQILNLTTRATMGLLVKQRLYFFIEILLRLGRVKPDDHRRGPCGCTEIHGKKSSQGKSKKTLQHLFILTEKVNLCRMFFY